MKKLNNRSLLAILLAVLIMCAPLTGCVAQAVAQNREELKEAYSQSANETNTAAPVSEQEVDCSKVVEEIQKQLDAANKALADAQASAKDLEAENAKLADELEAAKAEIDALKAEVVPAVEVIDGAVYCDVDYFIERATVTFADGTAALHAIEEGTEVVLDDVHALNERGNYRANTMMLPIKGGNVAVTFDGKTAIAANLHQHKSVWTLCKGSAIETGFELVEKQKDGVESEWLQVTAVCVENAASEFGYDFYVVVKEEAPVVYYPPVQQQPATQPEVEKPEVEEPKEETPKEDEPDVPDVPDIPDVPDEPKDEEDPKNNSTNEGGDDMREDDYSDILNGEQENNSTNDGWQDLVDDLKQDVNNGGTSDDSCNGDSWQDDFNGTTGGNDSSNTSGNDDTWLPSISVDCDWVENSNNSNNGWESNVSVESEKSDVDSNIDSWTPANTGNNGFADLIASFG